MKRWLERRYERKMAAHYMRTVANRHLPERVLAAARSHSSAPEQPVEDDLLGVQLRARLYGSTQISSRELRLLQAAAWSEGYRRGKERRTVRALFRKTRGMLINPYGGEL